VRAFEVRRVLSEGKPLHGTLVVAFLAPGTGRVAFVASGKVGGAARRNRAKRVMRAAWREVESRLPEGHDVAWVARSAVRSASADDLVREMKKILADFRP
jgi:ribonuclease P protein component